VDGVLLGQNRHGAPHWALRSDPGLDRARIERLQVGAIEPARGVHIFVATRIFERLCGYVLSDLALTRIQVRKLLLPDASPGPSPPGPVPGQ